MSIKQRVTRMEERLSGPAACPACGTIGILEAGPDEALPSRFPCPACGRAGPRPGEITDVVVVRPARDTAAAAAEE